MDIATEVQAIRFATGPETGRMFVDGLISEDAFAVSMYLLALNGKADKSFMVPPAKGSRADEILQGYYAITPHAYAGAY